jgi:uncharacterized protein (DUF1697 family)
MVTGHVEAFLALSGQRLVLACRCPFSIDRDGLGDVGAVVNLPVALSVFDARHTPTPCSTLEGSPQPVHDVNMALVVFLRGVNVGGYRTFRPSELARQMKRYDVVNIGAAGTFVVRARVSRTAVRAEISRRLPFDAEIIICEGRDVAALAASDPFAGQASTHDLVHFVSVLSKRPATSPALPLCVPADDDWCVRVHARRGQFLIGAYRRQMRAIGYLGKFEKTLRVPLTTRSWTTILAIARVLQPTGQTILG